VMIYQLLLLYCLLLFCCPFHFGVFLRILFSFLKWIMFSNIQGIVSSKRKRHLDDALFEFFSKEVHYSYVSSLFISIFSLSWWFF
jgi:hypothetical protein